MMLLSVPAANSCPGFPATVTRPGFVGCLYWRWLPVWATWNHPSSRSCPITSRTFITKITYRHILAPFCVAGLTLAAPKYAGAYERTQRELVILRILVQGEVDVATAEGHDFDAVMAEVDRLLDR